MEAALSHLHESRDAWDKAAEEDALFNILTLPEKANGAWDPDDFYEHGRREVAALVQYLTDELELGAWGRALDFGCGAGRLTRALAEHFAEVIGVDISRGMIDRARAYTPEPGVSYLLNVAPNLCRVDPPFDLVYSVITLQHIEQESQGHYIAEFVRLLSPEGYAVFQVNEGGECPNGHLSMYGVTRAQVYAWVEGAGGEVVEVMPSNHTGNDEWPGYVYAVQRG